MPDLSIEKNKIEQGFSYVCGIDEAGRGPLCGPVVAAACIMPIDADIPKLNDSKKLTPKKRDQLFDEIKEHALAYAIGVAQPVSIRVETYGTGKLQDEEITALLRKTVDMTPAGIIRRLDLRRPIYAPTAEFGHFGVADRPWEQLDLAPVLKELAGI